MSQSTQNLLSPCNITVADTPALASARRLFQDSSPAPARDAVEYAPGRDRHRPAATHSLRAFVRPVPPKGLTLMNQVLETLRGRLETPISLAPPSA